MPILESDEVEEAIKDVKKELHDGVREISNLGRVLSEELSEIRLSLKRIEDKEETKDNLK